MKFIKRKGAVLCALLALLLNATAPLAAGARDREPATSSVIRTAPPAPVFDEKTRQAELAARRARVAQSIGSEGILILFSTEPRVYTNDVEYEYRQENNLYYLTNLKQRGATLVMTPGNSVLPEILFLPRRNPRTETWTGHMYSAAEASQISGVKEIWEASEFEPFLRALRNRQPI
jgi:Xaa-Pro aminopeptidase